MVGIKLYLMKDNQDVIRNKLIQMQKNKYYNSIDLAKLIGISPTTLIKFLNGKDMAFRTLMKIEKYINKDK